MHAKLNNYPVFRFYTNIADFHRIYTIIADFRRKLTGQTCHNALNVFRYTNKKDNLKH